MYPEEVLSKLHELLQRLRRCIDLAQRYVEKHRAATVVGQPVLDQEYNIAYVGALIAKPRGEQLKIAPLIDPEDVNYDKFAVGVLQVHPEDKLEDLERAFREYLYVAKFYLVKVDHGYIVKRYDLSVTEIADMDAVIRAVDSLIEKLSSQ